ncbi:hypothetical protein [Paucisalibacillus sp. EB02]|uniref:hypothetical protein n=1 Tax=Paucisalibacillus sp. EB02 TaxID=1347087 RepID=UPI0005A6D953|nr:hypothetical protein [Paucisalibacillus sp. EB02]
MIYHATPQRTLLLFLLIGGLFASRGNPQLYYFLIPYSIFLIMTVSMNLKLKVGAGSLTFIIRVLILTIYKKRFSLIKMMV